MTHPYWRQIAVARHEAAHCIAAQVMGLRVPWVSIVGVESAGEIHMAATGIEIEGEEEADSFKLAVEMDLSSHPQLLAVCVTTAQPVFTTIESDPFFNYSVMEYRQAVGMAESGGISDEEIDFRCEAIADERHTEILDLAERLMQEGRIEFASA